MSDELLAAYIFLNTNWKFARPWRRLLPSACVCLRMHGPQQPAEEQTDEEVEEGDDEEGAGEGAEGA